MSLNIGENVGAYRIVEQLGQGGMATVFKAYHASLDRYVAIKVLHPAFKEDPTFLARFQREARVVAKLEHPNIVPVYDYADHNGAPYLVMKFIEGETLKAQLTRGAINLAEGLHIIEAVGAGLAYAHRQGILHRDIKPSNIMLARDGNIYLADFGLARIALAGESTLSTDSMLGTPHYMSPEQAKGVKDLDAGTDIYSLGVVIYELVVGRVPYSADTPFAIIHDHIFTPLPLPHTVNPNVPESIERVLLKALAKDRADRYQDVPAMVKAFREAVTPLVASDAASAPTALPRPMPVSPSAVTPVAGSTVSAPGPTVVMAAPSTMPLRGSPATPLAQSAGRGAQDAPASSEPVSKKGYTFKWWHALIGAGLIMCCLFSALAAANRANRRKNQPVSTATQVVATEAATAAPVMPTAGPMETPAPADVKPLMVQAEQAFSDKQPAEALAALNQAVALNPNDIGVWEVAGDMALTHGFALHALQNYYVPGFEIADKNKDPLARELHDHAFIGFYIAAADPLAGEFIQGQIHSYPDRDTVGFANLRFNIFDDPGEGVLRDLERVLKERPDLQADIHLLLGDYFLKHKENLQARLHYNAVLEAKPDNRPVPRWMQVEAQCELAKIADQKLDAKLEASCEDPASLLIGK